jgi:hypothetical protein
VADVKRGDAIVEALEPGARILEACARRQHACNCTDNFCLPLFARSCLPSGPDLSLSI